MNPSGAWRLTVGLLALTLLTSCGGGSTSPVTPTPDGPAVTEPIPADPGDVTPGIPSPDPETPSTRVITGTVQTPQGLPVPGASIATGEGVVSLTDAEGHFELGAQPVSVGTVIVQAPGFTVGTVVVPLEGDPVDLTIILVPLPVEDVDGVEIQAESGLGGTLLEIPVPGPNLPFDYFIYRRTSDTAFDWDAPLNAEPLHQVEMQANGSAATIATGNTLAYRDQNQIGGAAYSYTVRLRDIDGRFGPPQNETPVTAAGFGVATTLDAGPNEVLLDTAPGANGSLVGLYRDLTYQPWHRFIGRRFDGQGGVTELFRAEGVYDDAQAYVDRFDIPYFLYRRNGIEFLFETFLMNYYDANGLSPDIHIGESYRKITGELSGDLLFRPDPEGNAPEETVAIHVDRDRQVVAQRWDYGASLPHFEQVLGPADTTLQPKLRTLSNRAGDIAAYWNRDFNDSAYWQASFLAAGSASPVTDLGTGQAMAVQAGVTGDDQFVFAVTHEPFATSLTFARYRSDGAATGQKSLNLAVEGCALPSDPDRMALISLPNGKTYFIGIVQSNTGQRELRAWDITDFDHINALGVITMGPGSEVPTSLEITLDYAGKVNIVTSEAGHLLYRRFFWPGE